MLGALGPRHERGSSATLPDVPRFIEGFVQDAIDGVDIDTEARTIAITRGTLIVANWVRDGDDLELRRSSRTQPFVNFDLGALEAGVYVRCEYHPGIGEYVSYWQSCTTFDLDDETQDDDSFFPYAATVEDVE